MRLIGRLCFVAVLATLLLPQAEGAGDKQTVALESEVRTLRGKVAGLEARLAAIERAVQVSGGSLKLTSAGGLVIQAGGAVTIQGGGTVDLRGAALHLNGGGRPVARVGDPVVVQGSQGQITAGSPTVLVQ
jgi:uncharacterized Zn-binding protein involved in type VI secretion